MSENQSGFNISAIRWSEEQWAEYNRQIEINRRKDEAADAQRALWLVQVFQGRTIVKIEEPKDYYGLYITLDNGTVWVFRDSEEYSYIIEPKEDAEARGR